jgi:hypothetical protein
VPTWLLLIIDHCSSNAHCAAAAQLGHSISSNIAASIAAFALATSSNILLLPPVLSATSKTKVLSHLKKNGLSAKVNLLL